MIEIVFPAVEWDEDSAVEQETLEDLGAFISHQIGELTPWVLLQQPDVFIGMSSDNPRYCAETRARLLLDCATIEAEAKEMVRSLRGEF